jgi:DNA-binding GntR family transcriptional regulator
VGCGVRTVTRALSILTETGLIERQRHWGIAATTRVSTNADGLRPMKP